MEDSLNLDRQCPNMMNDYYSPKMSNCPMYNKYMMGDVLDKNKKFNNMMENAVNLPPYMYGKCVNPYGMQNVSTNMYDCRGEYSMYMNPNYSVTAMEPLDNMNTKLYRLMYTYIQRLIRAILSENMGTMPNAISKEKFNNMVNEGMNELLKDEDKIKKLVIIERIESEENKSANRAFCPYCSGMLNTAFTSLFILELLRGGCAYCY